MTKFGRVGNREGNRSRRIGLELRQTSRPDAHYAMGLVEEPLDSETDHLCAAASGVVGGDEVAADPE